MPPYMINNFGNRTALDSKTVAVSAMQYDNILHYDAHNLYGISESIATHQALLVHYSRIRNRAISNNNNNKQSDTIPHLESQKDERPFVLSRSTFIGSGRWASHWTGDNASTWNNLRWSIVSVLNSNIFGMTHVGADICGFLEDTTEELCARWIALGALTYSFARSHNDIHATSQEPYLWPATKVIARKAITLRQSNFSDDAQSTNKNNILETSWSLTTGE